MFRFLNKIFGSLVALFLYPIKSLLVSLGLILINLLCIPLFVIGFPIALAIYYALLVNDLLGFVGALITASLSFVMVGLLSIVIFPPLILISVLGIIYNGIFDLFRAARFGIQDGYEQGLFFHVLKRFLFDIVIFNSGLQQSTVRINQLFQSIFGHNQNNDDVINGLNEEVDIENYFDLEDVPRSSLEQIPELHEQPKPKKIIFEPLSMDELQQAEGLSNLIGEGKVISAYK